MDLNRSLSNIVGNVTLLLGKATDACYYSGAPWESSEYGIKLLDNITELITKNTTELFGQATEFCDINDTPDYIAQYGGDLHSFDDEVVVESLKIFGSFYIVAFLVFCVVRIRLPKYFNIRSWVPELKCDLAFKQYGFFSWFWEVYNVPDEEILEQCGMDALCFIRVLKFLRKLAIFGCFNAIYLLPIYATSPKSPETALITDKLAIVTTANIPSYSHRFLATVVAAYLIFIYTMYSMKEEFEWYTEYRHKFLMQHRVRNYAVYVSGVPKQIRSNYALLDYFRKCSSTSSVLEARIVHDLPHLEAKVSRRDAVIGNIEAACLYEKVTGKKKKHLSKKFSIVETKEEMQKELDELNRDISVAINKIMNTDDRRRSQLHRTNPDLNKLISAAICKVMSDNNLIQSLNLGKSASKVQASGDEDDSNNSGDKAAADEPTSIKDSLREFVELTRSKSLACEEHEEKDIEQIAAAAFEETVMKAIQHEIDMSEVPFDDFDDFDEYDEEEAIVTEEIEMESTNDEDVADNSFADEIQVDRKVKFSADSSVDLSIEKTYASSNSRWSSDSRWSYVKEKAVDISGKARRKAFKQSKKGVKIATDIGSNAIKSTTAVANLKNLQAVGIYVGLTEGYARPAGFVVFGDLYTKQAALQMVHHAKAGAMEVSEAPDPMSINWTNVGLRANAKQTGWILSWGATIALCLFWWIPVLLISSLTEVNSLKLQFPKLEGLTIQYPWLEMCLAQIAPVLLIWLRDILLPEVLKYFSTWEGHISFADLEAALFAKLTAFMIFQTFFITLISGSVAKNLYHMMNNPSQTIDFLALALPAEYRLFIQILLADAFFIQGFELLRGYPLSCALVRRFVGPNRTAKERSKSFGFIHSLEEPPDFYIARNLAIQLLFFMIFFVYATIAPVISFILVLCLIVMESGFRYHFYHNHHKNNDSGGRAWVGFAKIALINMIIAQIALTGMLVLKNTFLALPFMIPLILLSAYFIHYANQHYYHKTHFLPTGTCLEVDEKNRENIDIDRGIAVGEYIQPCLKHRMLYPDLSIES